MCNNDDDNTTCAIAVEITARILTTLLTFSNKPLPDEAEESS